MTTKIPPEIQEYIDIVENEKCRVCEEQKLLIAMIKRIFKEETLKVNYIQIEKYMSYQKYFPFNLYPWEKFVFVLKNCVYEKNGNPRFPDIFIYVGRGAGKNGLMSFDGFCMITETNDVAYYNIDIFANSEKQAKTSFDEIYEVLEHPIDPNNERKLRKNFTWNKTEIINKKTKSKINYHTAGYKSKDGLRPGQVDFDEVHQYESAVIVNSATGALGKKPHPRRLYVSTDGDVREGVLDQLKEKSFQILNGTIPDMGFLPFICRLDSDEEVKDPDNWSKANPSLPYDLVLMNQILREYEDYKIDPVINSYFMTKRMNRPQGNKDIEVTSWDNILKTNEEIPDLDGKTCVCGIDFIKTTDFMSVFLLFKLNQIYYGIHHSWFCNRSRDKDRIKIPLDEMVARKLLTIIDDVEVHPHYVVDWIDEMRNKYDIEKIAIDSYRYALLSRELEHIGYSAKDKRVKLVRPSDIMYVQPKIASLFVNGGIVWGDDPLMRWYTNNTKLVSAPNNNFKYDKIEPKSRKNDGFMAFAASMTIEEELPEEEDTIFMAPLVF